MGFRSGPSLQKHLLSVKPDGCSSVRLLFNALQDEDHDRPRPFGSPHRSIPRRTRTRTRSGGLSRPRSTPLRLRLQTSRLQEGLPTRLQILRLQGLRPQEEVCRPRTRSGSPRRPRTPPLRLLTSRLQEGLPTCLQILRLRRISRLKEKIY